MTPEQSIASRNSLESIADYLSMHFLRLHALAAETVSVADVNEAERDTLKEIVDGMAVHAEAWSQARKLIADGTRILTESN